MAIVWGAAVESTYSTLEDGKYLRLIFAIGGIIISIEPFTGKLFFVEILRVLFLRYHIIFQKADETLCKVGYSLKMLFYVMLCTHKNQ